MQDEVKVSQADEAKALEVFNDALGDIGSFAEFGRPSYQDGALRTIAVHLARHRHQAERGEVVAWMVETRDEKWLAFQQENPDAIGIDYTETPLYALPTPPEAV